MSSSFYFKNRYVRIIGFVYVFFHFYSILFVLSRHFYLFVILLFRPLRTLDITTV